MPVVAISKTWPWIGEVKALAVVVKRKDLFDFIEHVEKDVEKIVLKPLRGEWWKVAVVFSDGRAGGRL